MSTPTGAVFLSYASQDADAARRICDALRISGIEVWFDQSELQGGDAWDRRIREQIHECRLFIPIVSANSEARVEGYFRREWKFAADRTHDLSERVAFLVPVVIDSTSEVKADVPDAFRHVQWTRLPGGDTSSAFVERVTRLLSPEASFARAMPASLPSSTTAQAPRHSVAAISWSKSALWALGFVAALALAYFVIDKLWISKRTSAAQLHAWAAPEARSHENAVPPTAAEFKPPPHSIAVLPFVNMSGDKEQEYFSDGLSQELLNSLARINELQVAARTSAFAFKGKDTDIGTIARKLNVGAILEGSVRRSGHTVRVTVQLNNAVTGFHLWSETYDRNLGDVLQLETEIANAVVNALKVTLLGDVAAKVELGGTRDPAAFDAYLRASKAFLSRGESKDIPRAIDAYSEAIRLDGQYALAYTYRSLARTTYASEQPAAVARKGFEQAQEDARRAIALAPALAEAHQALGYVLENGTLDFVRAREAYDRAMALAPGNATVLLGSSEFGASIGHFDAAITAARRAVMLDPLDRRSHSILGRALYGARRYGEAADAQAEAIRVNPDFKSAYGERGLAFYGLGDLEKARASCETMRDDWLSQQCLAVVYDKLGRHVEAEAELAKMKAAQGDSLAYQYATIYAQWGDRGKALESLDTAMRLRDPGLVLLKTDPLFDPLRNEPRFQALERELKFPN
ncbi:MAG TPA: TIR domain-containing protein [Steroidobacteraceae bacterium]|nr:TIR domain-containing protein [Steroidobacteraceae bacterium]